MNNREIRLNVKHGLAIASFEAMASPCLIIVDQPDHASLRESLYQVASEAWRIEQKYSRYCDDSLTSTINQSIGCPVAIDEETYQLLSTADCLWQESDGRFDITSGVFRNIWKFDGRFKFPSDAAISKTLRQVGWDRVQWSRSSIVLPVGMQIDFGGIGKEYAADRCAMLALKLLGSHTMVNLGGDIVVNGPKHDGSEWDIGIESHQGRGKIWRHISFAGGAMATSGDAYRSILYRGIRYSHIINARTGIPVTNAPHSVTVMAPNCTEAGMLSTLALLNEGDAERFLAEQGRPFWVQR